MADTENNTDNTEDSFTNIDPATLSPELQEVYKSMQAGFTKKTQELSRRQKEFTDKEAGWEESLKKHGAVEAENKKWHDWYQGLQEEEAASTTDTTQDIDLSTETDTTSPDIRKLLEQFQASQSSTVNNLTQEVETLKTALKNTTDQTSRMFNYQSQLGELEKTYENLDKQEVLDHALKIGQPDLKKAYADLHHDELIQLEVDKRVEEELVKRRTQGIRAGAQQIIVKTRDNAPKSFAEATEQIANSMG
jgi:hypothetical protein